MSNPSSSSIPRPEKGDVVDVILGTDGPDVIAGLGLTGIELNSGGFLPPVHIPTFDDILSSDTARDDFLGQFEGTGVEIAGLNCNGNPLHPDAVIGPKHAEDVRRSIRLANRLGQHRVVTMSGLPAGEPGGKRPNWIVNAWNSAALDVLDYQWSLAAEFWREIDRDLDGLAARRPRETAVVVLEPRQRTADQGGATHRSCSASQSATNGR
jgi:sugar phosphate isomerase/epimerase